MFYKKMAYCMAAISLLGFLDATYLTIKHYQGIIPPCSLLNGCETVLTSSYSSILGLPVALLGAIYYLTIFLGSILYLDLKQTLWLKIVSGMTVLGFLAAIYFFYLQWAVIKAWCPYCLLSAGGSTLLFACGATIQWKLRTEAHQKTAS